MCVSNCTHAKYKLKCMYDRKFKWGWHALKITGRISYGST